MKDAHPTYANPTIREAICEIHFRLPDHIEWRPSLSGELFKRIQQDFPVFEPAIDLGFQLQVGPKGAVQGFLPPRQRVLYRHISRPLLLQLSDGILAVNELPQYPGWEEMKRDVLSAWGEVREVVEPARVTRIGLRYINHIRRESPDERVGTWLSPSQYIPEATLSSLPGFLLRSQTRSDAGHRLIVTLGEMEATSGDDAGVIVFDIDGIVEKDIGVASEVILEELEQLHEPLWQVFWASRTSRLEALLEGREV